MCDFIQNYIKDGNYKYTAEIYPSCVYPNGSTGSGTTVITSTYECGNPTKFLQKNIKTTTVLSTIIDNIILLQKFDIACDWQYMSTTGYSLCGKFKYCPKKNNIFICSKGYSNATGKIETIKLYFDTIPTGYIETFYAKVNGVWIPIHKRTYTRVSP